MSRAVWDVVAPIVRTHPDIQRSFAGHPQIAGIGGESDDARASRASVEWHYITGGLYLRNVPFNFMSRAIDPQHKTTEYLCDFMDGDYLVKVDR